MITDKINQKGRWWWWWRGGGGGGSSSSYRKSPFHTVQNQDDSKTIARGEDKPIKHRQTENAIYRLNWLMGSFSENSVSPHITRLALRFKVLRTWYVSTD